MMHEWKYKLCEKIQLFVLLLRHINDTLMHHYDILIRHLLHIFLIENNNNELINYSNNRFYSSLQFFKSFSLSDKTVISSSLLHIIFIIQQLLLNTTYIFCLLICNSNKSGSFFFELSTHCIQSVPDRRLSLQQIQYYLSWVETLARCCLWCLSSSA